MIQMFWVSPFSPNMPRALPILAIIHKKRPMKVTKTKNKTCSDVKQNKGCSSGTRATVCQQFLIS